MKNVLVLCTGNSCRSVMAEALINHLGAGNYKAVSAGSKPAGYVHPKSVETLKRHGIDSGSPRSKSWDEFEGQSFDLVITVCDAAASEACPVFLGNHEKLHWPTPDPAAATGSEADITAAFDEAFTMLKERVERELLSRKRPIDKQREAAITLTVSDEEDSSPIVSHLSTSNALYTIKENSVLKVQLADDIDPARTNPNVPNLSQKILSAGNNNEIVARILLTAKCLFDEKNATVTPFVAALFEQSIDLTRHVLELSDMISELREKITQKERTFEKREHKPNAFSLPSIPDLDKDLHNMLIKANKSKDSIYSLYRLHFLPDANKKPELKEYDSAIQQKLASHPDILEGWKDTKRVLVLINNMRNASEHRRDGNQLKLQDFKMEADGSVNSPIVEIEHKDTPIEPVNVIKFINFIESIILDHAEGSIVIIKCSSLLDRNPFNEQVGFLPPENRRHPFVRYCRAINLNGEMRILG